MKILQICNKVPFPPQDGHTVAMNIITQGLINEGHEVKVLAMNTMKHYISDQTIDEDYKKKTNIELVLVNTAINFVSLLLNFYSTTPYLIVRFLKKEFSHAILKILNNSSFDIIHIETLYLSPYLELIKRNTDAKIVLRAHNIEYNLWENRANNEKNIFKKCYLKILAKKLKKFELKSFHKFDGIAAISENDLRDIQRFVRDIPIEYIPIGIEVKDIEDYENDEKCIPSLFYIGALDWEPNIEGLFWFLDNIWSKVLEKFPELKLYIAGRNINHIIHRLNYPNIVVVGEVENADEFMKSYDLMIVPLNYGGGARVKILEGMANGKVILSTSAGAKGINYVNFENILLADNEDEFINMISYYFKNHKECQKIGVRARNFIKENYGVSEVTVKLTDFYKHILSI